MVTYKLLLTCKMQIPKRVPNSNDTNERSRLECLEELEKELMFIGIP